VIVYKWLVRILIENKATEVKIDLVRIFADKIAKRIHKRPHISIIIKKFTEEVKKYAIDKGVFQSK